MLAVCGHEHPSHLWCRQGQEVVHAALDHLHVRLPPGLPGWDVLKSVADWAAGDQRPPLLHRSG